MQSAITVSRNQTWGTQNKMDHIKGSRHVCRTHSVPQSTQRLIGSCGEILLIRKLCSSLLNKFEMCCPVWHSTCCDTVPTWSVRKYQHELKSWSLFNFAIYHTFCTVWNVQNYVIALIKQTLQFHSNSFMFVSVVLHHYWADWSARRSQHGLGLGSMGTHHMSDFTCLLVLMTMMTRFRCQTCAGF